MSRSLGIEPGTTFVAAAVARDRRAEMVRLGDTSALAHGSVHVGENGSLTNRDAAARRAVSDPDRGTHDLERRPGVRAPVMLDGVLFTVTALLGALLRTVLARAVNISATWEPVPCRALADVAESAGLTPYSTVTEPDAAAAHHGATRHFEIGEVFAVHDLGGGTSDATVLRRTPDGTSST